MNDTTRLLTATEPCGSHRAAGRRKRNGHRKWIKYNKIPTTPSNNLWSSAKFCFVLQLTNDVVILHTRGFIRFSRMNSPFRGRSTRLPVDQPANGIPFPAMLPFVSAQKLVTDGFRFSFRIVLRQEVHFYGSLLIQNRRKTLRIQP